MAWVRYDDNFHDHDKVAVVRAEAPEALALHLLANTWTSRTDRPGFVPSAIPTVLVGRAKGRKWTELLVSAGLWVEVEGGWEFYNWKREYGPVARPSLPQATRAAVYIRDGSRCRACGTVDGPFTIDHIMPLVLGGGFFDISNLQVLCRRCNRAKWTTHPDEWTRMLS